MKNPVVYKLCLTNCLNESNAALRQRYSIRLPILPPQSVRAPSVLVAVGIQDGQDVPVKVLGRESIWMEQMKGIKYICYKSLYNYYTGMENFYHLNMSMLISEKLIKKIKAIFLLWQINLFRIEIRNLFSHLSPEVALCVSLLMMQVTVE